MKRPLIFVLLVFFLLSCLAGCGREKENGAVAVEYGGTVFLVDKSAGTIRGGSHTLRGKGVKWFFIIDRKSDIIFYEKIWR